MMEAAGSGIESENTAAVEKLLFLEACGS